MWKFRLSFKTKTENCFTVSGTSLPIYFPTTPLACDVKGQSSVVHWFSCCTEQAINCLPSFALWQCCFLGSFYLYYTIFDEGWVDVREIKKIKKEPKLYKKVIQIFPVEENLVWIGSNIKLKKKSIEMQIICSNDITFIVTTKPFQS